MENANSTDIKQRIVDFALNSGADIIGFAPVERWDEYNEVPEDFRPRSIFDLTKTVIVMGMGMTLPIVETTPSNAHMELYTTVNRELDSLGYRMSRFLCRVGIPAIAFPRDGFGSIKILKTKPYAAFSHVYAGKYAGLGTIGMSNNLLTSEFGPRVRLVSVLASVELEGSPMHNKELCISCKVCSRCCPTNAIKPRSERIVAEFDKMACTLQAEELTRRRCYPCGICIKVCPIGMDRELYNAKHSIKKYLNEAEALKNNPEDPEYKTWNHFRKWGSWSKEDGDK